MIEPTELIEQWKPIKDYEGLYEISNFGRVKSLPRQCKTGRGGIYNTQEHISKSAIANTGYYVVSLWKKGKSSMGVIHQLVWDHFGIGDRDGRRIQVDHKDNNKQNCRIDNLQLLTLRENGHKYQKTRIDKTSKYIGVSWSSNRKKWRAMIWSCKKPVSLGYYKIEEDAANAYQNAFNKLGLSNAIT